MSVKLVPDLKTKIAEGLNWKLVQVEDVFEVDEDKLGFFVVTLKPKRFLDLVGLPDVDWHDVVLWAAAKWEGKTT